MGIEHEQAEALALLGAAEARARVVVDARLLDLAQSHIEWLVGDGPEPAPPADEREADVAAVIDQMLLDVAGLDDAVVQRAGRHFPDGGLADLVTASYVIEARTRLHIAATRLLEESA